MIVFTHNNPDQNTEVSIKGSAHIDDIVQAFINFLRGGGYHEDTIARGLASNDLVDSYLNDNEEDT